MTTADPIVIASYARTPMGGMQGVFSDVAAPNLGAAAVRAAVERAGITGEAVDQIIMGCVLPAGQGQAPGRQAAILAGLGEHVTATTINKMCGSGMQAAIMAHDALLAGSSDIVVAGGMESMTNAPYLLPKHRGGARLGHDVVKDSMFLDGLEDAYNPGRLMGAFAEDAAQEYQFTRETQDDYAIRSLTLAREAGESGAFDREITPVTVKTRKAEVTIDTDEQPAKANVEKIPTLRPAFAKDGTVTAANSSSISDGAAALVMCRASTAQKMGMNPVARVVGHASHAHEPARFTTAPVFATKKLFEKTGWGMDDVDLFEVNEAFAVVALIAERDLGIERDRLNVNGGACALGHPIGASGARIMATLLGALENRNLKRGVASICIGGGEATAIALERF
ncbi:acetyl-CoA C-acyltransferase [Croceicoccus sediminis]|uniref:acetyl-CoA C-acyltransferase n=1 Tax=Croceicoccus sediminis TaxID=2571150 RepID=UPI001184421D|nr:acetyl-CoA C-acyltransferase [Croceicoccus sediminis]